MSGEKSNSSFHTKILIGMVVGVVAGLAVRTSIGYYPEYAGYAKFAAERIARPIGEVFIRMVSMVIVPLVFSALVLGVVEIGDPRRLGRIGLRTLLITGVFSLAAVLIGVGLTNFIQPGAGLSTAQTDSLLEANSKDAAKAVAQAEKAMKNRSKPVCWICCPRI